MELKLKNGDYVPDGMGGLQRVNGHEELLQRVLFCLTARRGMFPFGETLGSRLWQLGRLLPSQRQAAAEQYDCRPQSSALAFVKVSSTLLMVLKSHFHGFDSVK